MSFPLDEQVEMQVAGLEPASHWATDFKSVVFTISPYLQSGGGGESRTHIARMQTEFPAVERSPQIEIGAEGVEPSFDPYKEPVLTVELRTRKDRGSGI